MKKKIFLALAIMSVFVCLLTISISAETMTEYCTAKITLTTNETVDAYFAIGSYGGKPTVARDTIYKSVDNSAGTYSWENVVVLDMSECQVVSQKGQVPAYLAGTQCNSLAKNVKTVYLPPMITEILGSSFTSGWSALETVYVPNSVTKIGSSAFAGSAVQKVVFSNGSMLTEIVGAAFQNCSRLSSINLEVTQLEAIGDSSSSKNAFNNCTSLETIAFPKTLKVIGYNAFYKSGLSGEIVVPNFVTELAPGAFLETNISKLVLGDGKYEVGFNFLSSPSLEGYIFPLMQPWFQTVQAMCSKIAQAVLSSMS